MALTLSPSQRADLEAAAAGERRGRVWRRMRAVLLLADGEAPSAVAAALLEGLRVQDPQARGHLAAHSTVPLLRAELAAVGVAASERTVRRALRRLGWRWKRPKYVLGRPDPAYAEKRGP